MLGIVISKTGTGGYCEDPELKRNVSANIAVDRRQGADSADSSTELSNKDYRDTRRGRAGGELCPCCDVLRQGG